MLSVSQSIDLSMCGPGVDPYVPPFATANKSVHIPKAGPIDGANRRSVYIKVRRNYLDPFLRSFDFPERGKPVGRRGVTIAPNQALTMLNSPLVNELAADWGSSVAEDDDVTQTIRSMWYEGLGRKPNGREIQTAIDLLEQFSESESHRLKHVAHLIFNHPDFMWID